jgi:hypothetical protein
LSELENNYSEQEQSNDDDIFPIDSSAFLDNYNGGFLNDYESQGQQITTVSKLQIKLNNLINHHHC